MTSGFQGAPPLGTDQLAWTPKPVSQNSCCTENSKPWIWVLLAFDGRGDIPDHQRVSRLAGEGH